MQPSTWNDERITAYVLGELLASEVAQIEADMQADADLATAVDEARIVTEQLTAMFAAESPMLLDAMKRKEIFGTPAALSKPPVVVPATASHGAARRYFALAASVLLLGTVATVFYRMDSVNRAGAPQVALAAKPMSETDAIDQPVNNRADTSGDFAKDAMSQSLQRDEFADVDQATAGQASVGNDSKSVAVDSVTLEFGIPATPMAKAPTTSAPMAGAAEIASEVFSRNEIAPFRKSNESKPDVSVEAVADNPRGARTVIDGEETKFKQETMPAQDLSKQPLGKELEDRMSMSMLDSALTVPPAPSGMPADMSNEPASSDFNGRAKPRGGMAMPRDGMAMDDMGMGGGMGMDGMASGAMAIDRNSGARASAGVVGQEMALGLGKGLSPMLLDPASAKSFEFQGQGAGSSGDRFERINENDFKRVSEEPLSTFSIDVDTASYSKLRQFILQSGTLPPAGAVRIEELVNYFDYGYEPPAAGDEHPFASRVEVAACPWKPEHRLARIAIKGKVIENAARPMSNLVFLVDTSGSMEEPNKLPLVKQGLQKLVGRLSERDRVAIVVYAGSAGLVLDSTPANDQSTILRKINQMQSGGSTNGGQGIRLAYQIARDHFIKDGVNRVILCSDGDFNVGTTSDDELVGLIETESKGGIDLTVLGFGMGNHNDSMMEKISGRGNGNYAFIDSASEANRVLVEQTSGTLVTIARDVKIQVEFNPSEVAAYRLIGYENRKLANEDFKDDTKDAGEIGAGHTVTALYELIPASGDFAALAPAIDELRYQKESTLLPPSNSGELMTVKLRYKKPDSDTSIPVSFPATDGKRTFADATEDLRFAAAVAGFGMLLRSSEHVGSWTMSNVQQTAEGSKGRDPHGLRTEFVEIVRRAGQLVVKE